MGGYVINFAVYTMAMLGLIFFALMVYKKTAGFAGGVKNGGKSLAIEETMTIAPRKTLYVVRAGEERFLIASDVDKTTLISKLQDNTEIPAIQKANHDTEICHNVENSRLNEALDLIYPKKNVVKQSFPRQPKSAEKVLARQVSANHSQEVKTSDTKKASSIEELPVIVDFKDKQLNKQQSVIRNMLKKINE